MPQPPAYNRTKDFTENFGTETDHSGLNAELDKVSNSINDVRANLAILQADDGKLRPEVVTAESVAPALFSLIVSEVKDDAVQLLADANAASANAIVRAEEAVEAAAAAVISKNAAAQSEANAAQSAAQALAAIGQPADSSVTEQKMAGALLVQLSRVVSSIAQLKAINKAKYARVLVAGYDGEGDGGGGEYYLDASDTTSADNGGTIIVASDGGRWKLVSMRELSVKQFGAKGDGATDDTAAFIATRNFAELVGARVVVPAGTYILQPATDLAADNTEWRFDAGALLKLHETQATTSFITFTRPVNQRVHGMRVDANRAAQNAGLFGQDNCAVLVVSAQKCTFDGTEIVSSPGKGLALVSEPGQYNRDVAITNFAGGDCSEQVLVVDGNNITGYFERIVIDGVRIGATRTFGVCLNDGAHSIALSNVIADVQNAVGDGVFVRDSFDIQMSNIRAKRGRNGVFFERLHGFTGRVEMDNVIGERNEQSGVLFLGAENITGGAVVGRNNNVAGINIAATSGDYRSKNIHIAAPAGYDDQGAPTQDYGILVQGVNGCRLGKHIAYGNTAKQLWIVRAQTSDVQAEVRRVATGSTGEIAAGGEGVVTLTWPAPFDDDNIDLESIYVFEATGSLALSVGHVVAITSTVVQVMVRNLSGTTAHTGTLTVAGRRTV